MGATLSSAESSAAALREAAATKVQAAARGRIARKDTHAAQMRGVVRMRVNLPAGWRAVDGVPSGLEFETRRHLALVGQQLVISKMRAFGTSNKVGTPDLIVHADRIKRVHRCEEQLGVFAVTLWPGESDRLFRAADEETRDKWVRALVNVSASDSLGGPPQQLGDG